MNRTDFLALVNRYIESDPEAAAFIQSHVQDGLRKALAQAHQRAADMEVVVAVLAAPRYKGKDSIVKEKLKKWEGKTALQWDWLTNPATPQDR